MSNQLPSLFPTAKDDLGPYIVISGYVWASLTVIAGIARFALALHRDVKLKRDDVSFALATLFVVASAVSYHLAAEAGLGKHISSLSTDNVTQYFKAMYAAQLLGLVAIGGGKLSAILLSNRVAAQRPRNLIIALTTIAVWTVFSLFATAFQCRLPQPWRFIPPNCPSRGNLQYPITALNMLTDILITALIVPQIWRLKMARESRITAAFLFGVRIIVPCVCVGQLISLRTALTSPDQPWANAPRSFLDQAVMGLSVISATVPRINRVLSSVTDNLSVVRLTNFELERSGTRKESGLQLTPPTSTILNTWVYGSRKNQLSQSSDKHTAGDSQSDKSLVVQGNVIVRTRKFGSKGENIRNWRNVQASSDAQLSSLAFQDGSRSPLREGAGETRAN